MKAGERRDNCRRKVVERVGWALAGSSLLGARAVAGFGWRHVQLTILSGWQRAE